MKVAFDTCPCCGKYHEIKSVVVKGDNPGSDLKMQSCPNLAHDMIVLLRDPDGIMEDGAGIVIKNVGPDEPDKVH